MSKKTHSQDSNSEPKIQLSFDGCYNYDRLRKEGLVDDGEIEWDIEELKKSIRDAADDYDKLVGG